MALIYIPEPTGDAVHDRNNDNLQRVILYQNNLINQHDILITELQNQLATLTKK